ncbi:MAG: hypothetical protein JJ863_21185 [Deltaproteobacteria bacterium]|nr:hypothetical protein [Deltaproteobacteria bacterium]
MFDAPATPRISKLTTVAALGQDAWRALDPAIGACVLTLVEPDEIVRRRRDLRKMRHAQIRRELGLVAVPNHGPGLVTTYLPGVPLSQVTSEGPRCAREMVRIGTEALELLAHAHSRGVVHGRLQKRHLIIGESVGLVGFGQTPSGATPQDDLRALAAILYECITGEEWNAWAPAASYHRPELGRAFDDWLAILADPERGFRDADQMRTALIAVGATLPPARSRIAV